MCRLKWHMSKPASAARAFPSTPLALAWSVKQSPPALVNELDELLDPRVVQADVLRVRDEERRRPLRQCRLQGLKIRIAVLVRHEGDDLVADRGRAGRVHRVREDRGDHLVPLPSLALCLMVGPHDGGCRVDRLAAARGLKADFIHSGDLPQEIPGLVHDLENPLDGRLVLIGMEFRHPGEATQLFVDLRAVLHRAGAHADVVAHVVSHRHLRQPREVSQHLRLGHLGQVRGRRSSHVRGNQPLRLPNRSLDLVLRLGNQDAALSLDGQVHQKGFVPDLGVIVPEFDFFAHAVTSSRTLASFLRSFWVWVSDTQ